MKFRFTADHFKYGSYTNPETGLQTNYCFADCQAEGIAERANALLDAEEKKCLRISVGVNDDAKFNLDEPTHTALLWNVEKIAANAATETKSPIEEGVEISGIKVVANPSLKDGEWYFRKGKGEGEK
jgi:hypothetical protein